MKKKESVNYLSSSVNGLLLSFLLITNVQLAQAGIVTYNVNGVFFEGATNGVNTFFNGSFDWDGAAVSNFSGRMNEAMQGGYVDVGNDYITGEINLDNAHQMLTLSQKLTQSTDANGIVTATVFKENTSDVYYRGGYVGDPFVNNFFKYGAATFGVPAIPGQVANENAFFTVVFDSATMIGLVDDMIYGDCTSGSLMVAGQACMAGEITGASTMAGTPLSISISEVSAVPVPAAVWLFGSALVGLVGANRRKHGVQ